MDAEETPVRIVGIGNYGTSVLAQLWLHDESRRLLEECGPVVWQVMAPSAYDPFRSLELSPALLHGSHLSRNKELSRALLSGANIEIKAQPSSLALDQRAHVLIGLGGSGAQRLIRSLLENEQRPECHVYACLPYAFDKDARERAQEELVTLQILLEHKGGGGRLNVTDRANFLQGSMLESMERIKDDMNHVLISSVISVSTG